MRRLGVILDVDGTLVDSNDAHARAWVAALRAHGRPAELQRVRRLIGMGGDKLLPAAAGLSADSPEGRAIAELRGRIFRERELARLQAFPGSHDLLRALKGRGYRLAVASSAQSEELTPLLRIAGAEGWLEGRTSGDDVDRSKPDPDAVAAALALLRCGPHEAVMIGDTPYDMEAARRAGVDAIGFRCGGWSDTDLSGAAAVYDGPLDLYRRLDSSPLRDAPGG